MGKIKMLIFLIETSVLPHASLFIMSVPTPFHRVNYYLLFEYIIIIIIIPKKFAFLKKSSPSNGHFLICIQSLCTCILEYLTQQSFWYYLCDYSIIVYLHCKLSVLKVN